MSANGSLQGQLNSLRTKLDKLYFTVDIPTLAISAGGAEPDAALFPVMIYDSAGPAELLVGIDRSTASYLPTPLGNFIKNRLETGSASAAATIRLGELSAQGRELSLEAVFASVSAADHCAQHLVSDMVAGMLSSTTVPANTATTSNEREHLFPRHASTVMGSVASDVDALRFGAAHGIVPYGVSRYNPQSAFVYSQENDPFPFCNVCLSGPPDMAVTYTIKGKEYTLDPCLIFGAPPGRNIYLSFCAQPASEWSATSDGPVGSQEIPLTEAKVLTREELATGIKSPMDSANEMASIIGYLTGDKLFDLVEEVRRATADYIETQLATEST